MHLFPWEIEAAILRMIVPANGGAIVERRWTDRRGNPASYRVVFLAQVHPQAGAEGPGDRPLRGENQS
jgi:hypothetical protein